MIDSGGMSLHYLLILINCHIPHPKPFDFNSLKNCMGRGKTHRQTHRRTSRLLDRIGPVGRFGEKGQVICDMGHVTHDTRYMTRHMLHVTRGGGCTCSQNVRSLALLVWEIQCFENISTRDDSVY